MNKRKIEIVVAITIVIVAIIVKSVSYRSFLDYEDTILSQQNSHILTIAKSISVNLETYVEERVEEVGSLVGNILLLNEGRQDRDRVEKELKLFLKFQNEISNVSYIDYDRRLVASYSKNNKTNRGKNEVTRKNLNKYFERVKDTKIPYISEVVKIFSNRLSVYIYYPVYDNERFKGIVLCEVDLNKVYEKIIRPIDIGKQGYIIVKSNDGIILMHPEKENIGYGHLELKKNLYSNLELNEVKELIGMQLEGEEGTYIGDSYLWTKDQEKNMYGFSPATIGENFWIVSVVMSYSGISDSIEKYFFSSLFLSLIVITVTAWTLILFIRMIKNKEAYKMEKSYLNELNETTEKLRRREGELHHKRKIELIGTLTGGIAHEFNDILTPIKGYSEMVLKSVEDRPEISEDVKIIYDSVKRSQEIIDQLLTYDNKKIKVSYEKLSLNELIGGLKKVLDPMIPEGVEVVISIDEGEKTVLGNETQLHQVVINLVKNAINAMKGSEEKKIKIKLSKETGYDGKKYVNVSVIDTGCGMTEETMEKIFTPFYTKKLSKKSTGLGLYVAEEILKNHGGSIRVDSKVGVGSKFELLIPLLEEERKKLKR